MSAIKYETTYVSPSRYLEVLERSAEEWGRAKQFQTLARKTLEAVRAPLPTSHD